ncbi:hypothetical protein [Rossellomorea sp. BNER]|uniref:hypothetical protein n=1 Tax=Rossellomorea sp. BNER TaxID=2962031 RepID=UPI003AF22440|nr:hypothetical protein [Rossellomorea sp. BNER]
MIIVFVLLIICLLAGYLISPTKKSTDLPDSDYFIVTAILSTLFVHGAISLYEKEMLESSSLVEIENYVIDTGLLSHDEWLWWIEDHCIDHPMTLDLDGDLV